MRAAKYSVKAAYIIVWFVIALVVGGPAAGFLTPRVSPQNAFGFGFDLNALNPQVQQIFNSSSTFVGTHQLSVPVFNKWVFPATASLSLRLIVNGSPVYQTATSSVELAPFQSGPIVLTLVISQSLASQLQGRQVTLGGTLDFGAPAEIWSLQLNFPTK